MTGFDNFRPLRTFHWRNVGPISRLLWRFPTKMSLNIDLKPFLDDFPSWKCFFTHYFGDKRSIGLMMCLTCGEFLDDRKFADLERLWGGLYSECGLYQTFAFIFLKFPLCGLYNEADYQPVFTVLFFLWFFYLLYQPFSLFSTLLSISISLLHPCLFL